MNLREENRGRKSTKKLLRWLKQEIKASWTSVLTVMMGGKKDRTDLRNREEIDLIVNGNWLGQWQRWEFIPINGWVRSCHSSAQNPEVASISCRMKAKIFTVGHKDEKVCTTQPYPSPVASMGSPLLPSCQLTLPHPLQCPALLKHSKHELTFQSLFLLCQDTSRVHTHASSSLFLNITFSVRLLIVIH